MRSWREFIVGIVVGAFAVVFCVFLYFRLGFAPMAVSAAPMPFETSFAHMGLRAATRHALATPSPDSPSQENLVEGAKLYRDACAECHGLPNLPNTSLQKNMFPSPPPLLHGKGVTDDPVGRTHWVVANGIRMTGMPSFANIYSDPQLWDVSQLLAHANELPPAALALLQQPDSIPVTPAAAPAQQSQ